jgi:TRAP-type mannitol/chloroaromatic compound transport system substrate-binding protein
MSRALPRRSLLAAGAAAPVAAPAVARAQERASWRMITSWPRDLPGPGANARRLAERITAMSGGRLAVRLYAAGELVPGLQVFDGVVSGVAEMGHSASIYWTGKTRAAACFTTVPWGLAPLEHVAWVEHGGGQQLWDELYAPFGLKPFMAGSSGMQMGGWFRRELAGLDDLRGLKIRAVGLSADVFQRLGAVGVVLPAGEIFQALQSGAVDAVEFLGPNSDRAQGFYQVAPYYYWPTFTKPNGTAECIVRRDAWEGLTPELRSIVEEACRAENQVTLAESEWRAAEALRDLVDNRRVQLRPWPDDVLRASRAAADEVLAGIEAAGEVEARIARAYREAVAAVRRWSAVSARAYLASRELA